MCRRIPAPSPLSESCCLFSLSSQSSQFLVQLTHVTLGLSVSDTGKGSSQCCQAEGSGQAPSLLPTSSRGSPSTVVWVLTPSCWGEMAPMPLSALAGVWGWLGAAWGTRESGLLLGPCEGEGATVQLPLWCPGRAGFPSRGCALCSAATEWVPLGGRFLCPRWCSGLRLP